MGYSAWSSYSYNTLNNPLNEAELKKIREEMDEIIKKHNEKEIEKIKASLKEMEKTNNENSNQFEVIGKRQIEL